VPGQTQLAIDTAHAYPDGMSIEELKTAVTALPPAELQRFSEWLDEYLADKWDERIEADILSGKLDKAGRQAIEDHEQGRCTPLP
jgi:hypothetical protein